MARTYLYVRWLCFWISVFGRNEFKRFLWFLVSLRKNGATLRKCYLFSFRDKVVQDVGICLKPHFLQTCEYLGNSLTDFSLISTNKSKSSLVLYLQVWLRFKLLRTLTNHFFFAGISVLFSKYFTFPNSNMFTVVDQPHWNEG